MSEVYRGTFDFDSDDDAEALRAISRAVGNSQITRNELIKALKRANDVLERAGQQSEHLQRTAEPLARKLLDPKIQKHENKDVRVYTASCFAHLLKMYAPDPEDLDGVGPFSDRDHQEIFQLIIWALGHLDSPNGPFFPVCFGILEVMRQVKFYLLPIDLECPSLLHELLKTFFQAISDKNFDALGAPMEEVIVSIFQTADEIPPQWIQVLLTPLVQDKENAGAVRLCRSVLSQTEELLKNPIQKFVIGTFSKFLASKSGMAAWCQKLTRKLGSVCPEAISSLIPHFVETLNDTNPGLRMEAVDIVGKLFSEPGNSFKDSERQYLIRQYAIHRFIDIKVEIRMKALSYFPQLVCHCGDRGLQKEIVKCACRGLHGREEKIRILTASGICQIAGECPEAVHIDVLKDALLRLKDVKPGVRKAVAQAVTGMIQKLIGMEKENCDSERIALAFGALVEVCGDPNCQKAFHLGISQKGLMPTDSSKQDCAHSWVQLFQDIDDHQAILFFRLLRNKTTLQASIASLLEAIGPSDERAGSRCATAIKQEISYIAKQCPDPAKATENLLKLVDVKDRGVFPLMAQHFGLTLPSQDADACRKEMLARVGSKSSLAEFLKILSAFARPTLITPNHLGGLIQLIHHRVGTYAGEDRHCALMLLNDIAKRAGILYASLGQELQEGLTKGELDLREALVYVMAKTAKEIRRWCKRNAEDVLLSELVEIMRGFVASSVPKLAKVAVIALNDLQSSSTAKQELDRIFSEVAFKLGDADFCDDPKTASTIQMLGSIGRVQPEVFSKHAKSFVEFLLKTYLPAPLSTGDQGTLYGMPCSPDVSLKCEALRAFAKGCVSDSSDRIPMDTLNAAKSFFDFLVDHSFLDFEKDHSTFGMHLDDDLAQFRMASAFAVLRMCRNPLLEGELPNKLYQDLAMMVQDTDLSVREMVATKLRKQLHYCYKRISSAAHRPGRYAACLALAGIDPISERRTFAKDCIKEFVRNLRLHVTKSNETAPNKQPEFLLPFLIFLVAHHDDIVETLTDVEDKVDDDEEGTAGILTEFQNVLVMGIEPVLSDPDLPDGAFSNYHSVKNTITALMKTEDLEGAGSTARTIAVCDMALAVLDGIMKANKENISSGPETHSRPAVPKRFYKWNKSKRTWPVEGEHLPKGFVLIEIEPCKQPRTKKKRQGQKKERVPVKRKERASEKVDKSEPKRRGRAREKDGLRMEHLDSGGESSLQDDGCSGSENRVARNGVEESPKQDSVHDDCMDSDSTNPGSGPGTHQQQTPKKRFDKEGDDGGGPSEMNSRLARRLRRG
ncbi:hypothetical protein BSKO_03861 [Bryopsis sp. KO-2023]|nr:hypothetical protein BSKO_03861 [Bryopsis sp. KO-2023]